MEGNLIMASKQDGKPISNQLDQKNTMLTEKQNLPQSRKDNNIINVGTFMPDTPLWKKKNVSVFRQKVDLKMSA